MKKILCFLLIISSLNMPCIAFVNSNLDVTVTQIPLSTQLKKYYNAYEYKITNVSNTKFNIVNDQIINGNDGSIAFATTMNNEPSAMARTWLIAGPLGLVTLGAGWVIGLLATPFVAIVSSNNKKKTQTESITYTNLIPLGEINSGENINVNTLVLIGSKPQLKLTIQDTKKNVLNSIVY